MDDLNTIKSAIESLLAANKILDRNGYCSVVHDTVWDRNFVQGTSKSLINIIKKNKLSYHLEKSDDWYYSDHLELSCDEVKTYALTNTREVIESKLVNKKKLKEMLSAAE